MPQKKPTREEKRLEVETRMGGRQKLKVSLQGECGEAKRSGRIEESRVDWPTSGLERAKAISLRNRGRS